MLRNGYGRFYYHNERALAHRISYVLFNGRINDGLLVLHECDNRKCVNPSHLHLGTYSDNMREAIQRKRALIGDLNPLRLHPESIKRGSAHLMAILNEEQVIEIKQLLASGMSGTDVADIYGVAQTTISEIKLNKKWTHVLPELQIPRGRANTSSKYIGVCWDKTNKKWKASVTVGKRKVYQESFNDELSAATAYDKKAKEYGRRLNFPAKGA